MTHFNEYFNKLEMGDSLDRAMEHDFNIRHFTNPKVTEFYGPHVVVTGEDMRPIDFPYDPPPEAKATGDPVPGYDHIGVKTGQDSWRADYGYENPGSGNIPYPGTTVPGPSYPYYPPPPQPVNPAYPQLVTNVVQPVCDHCFCKDAVGIEANHKQCCKCMTTMHIRFIKEYLGEWMKTCKPSDNPRPDDDGKS